MSASIPGNTGKIINKSYQDLAKDNVMMLEALKRIRPYTMPRMSPPPGKKYEHYQASMAVREAITKAGGR